MKRGDIVALMLSGAEGEQSKVVEQRNGLPAVHSRALQLVSLDEDDEEVCIFSKELPHKFQKRISSRLKPIFV